jgi:hypothetical protein
VAVVARVLLDHVHIDPAQGDLHPLSVPNACSGRVEVGVPRSDYAAVLDLVPEALEVTGGVRRDGAPEVPIPLFFCAVHGVDVFRIERAAEPVRSTSVRWRTSPSRLSTDGGTEGAASCSAASPSHLPSRVTRWKSSQASSIARSGARNGGSCRRPDVLTSAGMTPT